MELMEFIMKNYPESVWFTGKDFMIRFVDARGGKVTTEPREPKTGVRILVICPHGYLLVHDSRRDRSDLVDHYRPFRPPAFELILEAEGQG